MQKVLFFLNNNNNKMIHWEMCKKFKFDHAKK